MPAGPDDAEIDNGRLTGLQITQVTRDPGFNRAGAVAAPHSRDPESREWEVAEPHGRCRRRTVIDDVERWVVQV